jgi:hypothetical protein
MVKRKRDKKRSTKHYTVKDNLRSANTVGHTINSAFILHLTGNVQYWCWTHAYNAFKLHSTGNLQYTFVYNRYLRSANTNPIKHRGELRCSGSVSSSCSACDC